MKHHSEYAKHYDLQALGKAYAAYRNCEPKSKQKLFEDLGKQISDDFVSIGSQPLQSHKRHEYAAIIVRNIALDMMAGELTIPPK